MRDPLDAHPVAVVLDHAHQVADWCFVWIMTSQAQHWPAHRRAVLPLLTLGGFLRLNDIDAPTLLPDQRLHHLVGIDGALEGQVTAVDVQIVRLSARAIDGLGEERSRQELRGLRREAHG